jgi:phosphoribosylaminoimidazole carboxylase PurE protein
MVQQKIVVIMGSKRDWNFASKIREFIEREKFSIECEFKIASAHRATEKVLQLLKEDSNKPLVYITIAGLSDSLSGVVAGNSLHPVIACPPDTEQFGWGKVFSSFFTPKGIPVACVAFPENAALAAIRIFALYNENLQSELIEYKHRSFRMDKEDCPGKKR